MTLQMNTKNEKTVWLNPRTTNNASYIAKYTNGIVVKIAEYYHKYNNKKKPFILTK